MLLISAECGTVLRSIFRTESRNLSRWHSAEDQQYCIAWALSAQATPEFQVQQVQVAQCWDQRYCIAWCCIFGSTNPCRITRNVKQMKDVRMYIEEFILVDVVTLLYKLKTEYALEML